MLSRSFFLLLFILAVSSLETPASAERYAVIISGIGGEASYSAQYWKWASGLYQVLKDQYSIPPDRLFLFVEEVKDPKIPAQKASLEAVNRTFTALAQRVDQTDLLFVLLIGHGNADAGEAKLSIPGPDLTAAGLHNHLNTIKAGRVVVVNGASASGPFIEALSAPGRIIITATKSGGEKQATIFPEHFLAALSGSSSDLDKDGRVSLLEAFNATKLKTAAWYDERDRIATEHPLLDDNGDHVGSREPGGADPDGSLARTITFGEKKSLADQPRLAPQVLAQLNTLQTKAQDLQRQIDALKLEKSRLPEAQYNTRLEALLIELAKVNREITRLKQSVTSDK